MSSETEPRQSRIRAIAGALTIIVLIFIAYSPILPGAFVMDDERLTGGDNPLVNGNLNLHTLWFGTDFTLATFGWWLEKMAFGNNPMGYHIVDLALHAASCLLLWRLLARLKIPGAWLAGALFAVHPVCVNSVARIAEMKNTLSLPFFFLSFLAYLRYEAIALYPVENSIPEKPRCQWSGPLWLVISLVTFVLALLAKTTAVTLPLVLLLYAVWRRRRLTRKDVLHAIPYFMLSLAFGLMSVWFQKHQALLTTPLTLVPETFWQRLAAAGVVFWFYLGKAFMPVNLSVAYPPIQMDAGAWTAYLPLLAIGVTFLICWRYRRTWGWQVLFALGCFIVTLFPALGFFNAQYQTMWNVSDHLQYCSLPAMVALAAAALAVWVKELVFPMVGAVLLTMLFILSFQRAQVFTSEENLVRDTLKKNPAAWAAHNDMGTILAGKKDYNGAIQEFIFSLQYRPNNVDELMNLGHALSLVGQYEAADAQFQTALIIDPGVAACHKAYGETLYLQGKKSGAYHQLQWATILQPDLQTDLELATWLYADGDSRQAVNVFRRALALDPDNLTALNDLAWILATAPEDSLRNGPEAEIDAQKACRLTAFKRPEMLSALAAAQAEMGDFSNAMATAQMAVNVAAAAGNTRMVSADEQFFQLYQAKKPYRERR
ncbi:MAG TPA: tetratricopeptide repeat protein [Verrucomicrobiae bacterium]